MVSVGVTGPVQLFTANAKLEVKQRNVVTDVRCVWPCLAWTTAGLIPTEAVDEDRTHQSD